MAGMSLVKRYFVASALVFGLSGPALAQDQTLADIRQELVVLNTEVQRLKRELSTTGGVGGGAAGGTVLDRVNTIEIELRRLTDKTEQLEFRIDSVVTDGTNRVGDLEFRLCELEEGCDISALGDTLTLGGGDTPATTPAATQPVTDAPQLATQEKADFERAQEALASR